MTVSDDGDSAIHGGLEDTAADTERALRWKIVNLQAERVDLREALRALLEDTQHSDHNCGDPDCPVDQARQLLQTKGTPCPPHDFVSRGDGTARCKCCGEIADVSETGAARSGTEQACCSFHGDGGDLFAECFEPESEQESNHE